MIDALKDRFTDPMSQAVLLLIACLLTMLLGLVWSAGVLPEDNNTPWIIAGAFTLFYASVNAAISLQDSSNAYFSKSITGYIIMMLLSAGLAYAFAGFTAAGAASIRWIFVIITLSYFIFLTIAFFMRKIIDYAQRQDTERRI